MIYYTSSASPSNFAFMVGLPWVKFLMVKSSVLLFAKRKLFSEGSTEPPSLLAEAQRLF